MKKEAHIEQEFIAQLQELKYTYRSDIRTHDALKQNFRQKFEQLNDVHLSDSEFEQLLHQIITPNVFAAARLLREINTFTREDGTPLHYTLVNIDDWCKNDFEVINQLRSQTDSSYHRYDVILLINGVPLVQIELKTLDVNPRRAMQQIVDYKNDKGNKYADTLLCFMQLFIVSNKNNTYYFANNARQHFNFNADERFLPIYQWATPDNKKVTHLHEFAQLFLAKCQLSQMISRYMVLVVSEQKIMMMRPYQIYAVQKIVECIRDNRGNGYIWHTTGSGKTLTSFKAATLLKSNPDIEKCLFVVDRKDLDRQTREEFNKFQENCVEENTNTATLVKRLLSDNYADKVIVTTIQKLGLALDESHKRSTERTERGLSTYAQTLEPLRSKRMAIIFDECHRSQFGDNHKAIKDFFPKAQLFGFTGTPIFENNAVFKQYDGTEATYKTTGDIFEKCLHTYTITHAIEDKNVLKFHVDYFKPDGKTLPTAGEPLARKAIANAILDKHDIATNSRMFNAILATASINEAIEYYQLFKELQAERQHKGDWKPLHIACVFSPPADGNSDIKQIQEDLPQEQRDNKENPSEKKAALTEIIADYNRQYNTNHNINNFDVYYQDIQARIKDQKYPNKDYPHSEKIDIIIVVDMLLTGFDSKYLNTLYVDKNLKYHGLIQAFSRTNRVLNDTKPYGNILDFRGQQIAVEEAIRLFSGEDTSQARQIWLVDELAVVLQRYEAKVQELQKFMASKQLACTPDQVPNLRGDTARSEFINHFKEVQRLHTELSQYTNTTADQKQAIEQLLPNDDLRGFRGVYLETARELKTKRERRPKLTNEQEQEEYDRMEQLDFEFVLFASALIDYDFIMQLIARYTQGNSGKGKYEATREQLINLLASSANLMDERDDLEAYINTLEVGKGLEESAIREGFKAFKQTKLQRELEAIATQHGLDPAALEAFAELTVGRLVFDNEQLTALFASFTLGWRERAARRVALMLDLKPYLIRRANGRTISGINVY